MRPHMLPVPGLPTEGARLQHVVCNVGSIERAIMCIQAMNDERTFRKGQQAAHSCMQAPKVLGRELFVCEGFQ